MQVTLKNNQKLFGTLKEETDSYITIDVGTPEPRKIMKTEIAKRVNGPSSDASDGQRADATRDSGCGGVSVDA